MDRDLLLALFSKPYGKPAPTEEQWRQLYDDDVHFLDPTQEKYGIIDYLNAQNGLINRCQDLFVEPTSLAIDGQTAFVEWRMGLKIRGIEFIYPGATRLLINDKGMIYDHRDYFDFVGPTFSPVPVIGSFVRWLYARFVD